MTMQTANLDKAVADLYLKFLLPYKQFMMWAVFNTRKTQVNMTIQVGPDLGSVVTLVSDLYDHTNSS